MQRDSFLRAYTFFQYDQALRSAKIGNISKALESIRRVDPNQITPYMAEYHELLGDIGASQSGSVTEIMSDYDESLSLREEPRVREKIRILMTPSVSTGSVSPPIASGSLSALQSATERIARDSENRKNFLSSSHQNDAQGLLSDTIDFLDTGKEVVDW